VKMLAQAGVTATGNYAAIQKLAWGKNLPLFDDNLPVVKEGWIGKPKGMYQVLWEI